MESINEYLAREFVARGAVNEFEAKKGLEAATKSREALHKTLLKLKLADTDRVYTALGNIFNIPYQTYSSLNLNYELIDKCSSDFIAQYRIVPVSIENDVLTALIDNPLEIISAKTLEDIYGLKVSLVLVNDAIMDSLILAITNKEKREEMKNKEGDKGGIREGELELVDDADAPAVALANQILEEAVSVGASDIHIEPQEGSVRVRFRIDGVLMPHSEISQGMYQGLVSRYKIISGLDIAERRIPQDGKISLKIKNVDYDFRISTLPIIYGEKIVIRIYDIFGSVHTLKTLANNKEDERVMSHMIKNPNGIILLTGPTGSGKTTTLYAMLRELNKPGVNIQTVEDPVENQIPGINQLQTNVKQGLTFASALRSILRQDPNVIMIGEIRDQETAHIAVQASITGHLVLSTIHTNDAITTVSRLIDMGIEPYLVSDSLTGAISQRLVRVLCPKCKKEHLLTAAEARTLGLPEKTKIYEPVGCPNCNGTGYKGRTAVYEIMLVGPNVKESISKKAYSGALLKDAAVKDGFKPLKEKVTALVEDGITSIEEFSTLINENI